MSYLNILQRNFSEELALMYLYNDDFDRSRHYAGCAVETFLQDWSSMDPLQAASRATTLQKLQRLTELQEFLTFISKDGILFDIFLVTCLIFELTDALSFMLVKLHFLLL